MFVQVHTQGDLCEVAAEEERLKGAAEGALHVPAPQHQHRHARPAPARGGAPGRRPPVRQETPLAKDLAAGGAHSRLR